jgi:hypothetical protein
MQLFHFQIGCTVLTKMLENFCIPPSFSPLSSSCCFPGTTGLKEKGAGGYERKHLFLISTDEGKPKKKEGEKQGANHKLG